MGWISIEAATQSSWYIVEQIAELTNDVIEYSEAFYTVKLAKPLPILEAPPVLEAPPILEAHGLVLSPKFRIFFKINQFSSEHMYPIRKINN